MCAVSLQVFLPTHFCFWFSMTLVTADLKGVARFRPECGTAC